MALAGPIADYAAVKTWVKGLSEQWGEKPDMTGRLLLLVDFCAFVERDPDAIIAECSREVETGKRIRIKARREYTEKIAEFQAANGADARSQARAGNIIRSFMIHNGIFMQAGLSG